MNNKTDAYSLCLLPICLDAFLDAVQECDATMMLCNTAAGVIKKIAFDKADNKKAGAAVLLLLLLISTPLL